MEGNGPCGLHLARYLGCQPLALLRKALFRLPRNLSACLLHHHPLLLPRTPQNSSEASPVSSKVWSSSGCMTLVPLLRLLSHIGTQIQMGTVSHIDWLKQSRLGVPWTLPSPTLLTPDPVTHEMPTRSHPPCPPKVFFPMFL